MKIHEYQGKALFREFNIPSPNGEVAFTPDEAVEVAKKLKPGKYVVKAQIHAGGRGKGGGVKVVGSLDEVRTAAQAILGMQLITHQTGPEGKKVKSVLVEEASPIARELYLAIVLDRATSTPIIMASQAGGMDIETVAEETPEKIIKEHIHPALGVQPYQARKIAYALDIPPESMKDALQLIQNLYQLFIEKDCAMVEINPLIITEDKRVFPLDAKINFDSNALYRHPDLVALRDEDEEDPLEVEASRYNLNYIKLDGNVGCIVNGAGLAMATMDIIKLHGESPANFLDVGGSATSEALQNAFRILLSDKNVEVVFINIFGGILRCDKFAEGVVNAVRNIDVKIPIVVRMKGTNVDLGKQILLESGLRFTVAETLTEAAETIASLVKSKQLIGS